VLSNGKRCPNAALPGSRYCGVPAHQELALHEPDGEANPIVVADEPELEELAETAEPEPVTEDAAEFGDAAPEEFPAGPGDAPITGPDFTPLSGEPGERAPRRVVDDPDEGVPIVHLPRGAEENDGER
jgi:N utilization substance protein A